MTTLIGVRARERDGEGRSRCLRNHRRVLNKSGCRRLCACRFLQKHAPLAVYLATDNVETQRAFLGRHRGRVRVGREIVPCGTKTVLRQTPLADAVVDLFCCAAADVFKGSYYSSFSETIAHLRAVSGRTSAEDEVEWA